MYFGFHYEKLDLFALPAKLGGQIEQAHFHLWNGSQVGNEVDIYKPCLLARPYGGGTSNALLSNSVSCKQNFIEVI